MPVDPCPLTLPQEDLAQIDRDVGGRWQGLAGQRLLLTGATGFIGKWLLGSFLHANRMHKLNARVVVVTRNVAAFLHQFPALSDEQSIEWVESDVRNLKQGDVGSCAFTIHAATDVAVTRSPDEILDVCIHGTQRVIEAARQSESARLLLLSSGAVYGSMPQGMTSFAEDYRGGPDCLSPASAYAEGKRVSELLCACSAATTGLHAVIARCFAFAGPHLPLDRHFAIGNFIDAAMHGRDIRIQGDGSPLRSYLYAAELTSWLWILLFSGKQGRAYNVGSDQAVSIARLAETVNALLGGGGKVCIEGQSLPHASRNVYVPDIARIRTEFDLSPRVSLDSMIGKTASWIRAEKSVPAQRQFILDRDASS